MFFSGAHPASGFLPNALCGVGVLPFITQQSFRIASLAGGAGVGAGGALIFVAPRLIW